MPGLIRSPAPRSLGSLADLVADYLSDRRALTTSSGPLAARRPATLVMRVGRLAVAAAKAVATLVVALLGGLQSVPGRYVELQRLRSGRRIPLLPARVQAAVGHAVLGKMRTVQLQTRCSHAADVATPVYYAGCIED